MARDTTIISSRIIQRPRNRRRCAMCHCWINGPQERLFGRAFVGDPVRTVYRHPDRSTCRENMRASYRREAVEVHDARD
jgi:hypothetical protein